MLKATAGTVSVATLNTDYIKDLSAFTTDDLTEGSTNLYDKTVVLTAGTGINVTGTYPDFTITSTGEANSFVGGNGIDITEAPDDTFTFVVNQGEISHTNIADIGTNTHAQIDTDLIRLENTSGSNTGDQSSSDFTHNSLTGLNDGTDYEHITQTQKTALHPAVTVTDSSEIDFTLTGQDLTADIKTGSVDETKLDTSVNASLDLADSSLQNISGQDLSTADNTISDFSTNTNLDLKINLTEKASNNGVATLDAGGKIPAGQLPSTVMDFKGNWNADTNTPTIADGTGDAGDVYLTSVAGTQDLGSGSIVFSVGDWVVYNGSVWEQSINSNAVVSVNSQTGVVSLDTGDVSSILNNRYVTDVDLTNLSNLSGDNTGDQDLSGYIQLAGGTMTGALKMGDNVTINQGGSDQYEQYFDGTNQRYELTSGAFKFNQEMFVDGQSITYGATGGSPSNTDNYHYQDALVWHHDSHNKDGAFVITLPSVGNSMSVFKIRGFNYGHSDGGNWEAIVSGYWRTSAGTWLYPSVDIIGTPPFSSVRLGKDATNMPVIILGEFTDTGLWDYPQITMDIYAGFQSQNGYATGVSAALVTDNTGYTGFVTPTMKSYYLDNGDFVFNGGNVGIGTTSPGEKLEVNGNIRVPSTTFAEQYGIIYKGTVPFIHDFSYGLNAGGITPVGRNTFVGVDAGNFTMGSTATTTSHGSYNNAIGYQSLRFNTTGYNNNAMGYASLYANTTGTNNNAMGAYSLYANTTGYSNNAMGAYSLYDLRPTSLAITAFADYSATVAGKVLATSVAHGRTTGDSLIISGTVSYNGTYTVTVISNDTFYFTKAWVATEKGWWTLAGELGSSNTGVGYNTGRGITYGSGNTILGASVTGLDAGLTNNIILANGTGAIKAQHDGTDWSLTGNVGIGTDAPSAALDVVGDVEVTGDLTTTGLGTFGSGFIGAGANYTEIKSDGEINLHGTARVKRGQWYDATGMKAPGTKPASYVDHGISGAWEFSDGTDDTLVFNLKIPEDMDRSIAPTLIIGWSTNTAVITETAVWQLEYLITASGDDTTAAAQDTAEVHSNAVAQSNGLIIAEFTGLDAAGSTDVCVHCRLKRLGADADDDLTDTAELQGICLSYTANKLGTAL